MLDPEEAAELATLRSRLSTEVARREEAERAMKIDRATLAIFLDEEAACRKELDERVTIAPAGTTVYVRFDGAEIAHFQRQERAEEFARTFMEAVTPTVHGQRKAESRALAAEKREEEAHAPLKALLDPAMPADLKGAVEYLIDHSNLGWKRAGAAEKREEGLRGILRSARSCITTDARDWSKNTPDAWIYGLVVGWDDDSLEEMRVRFGWNLATVLRLREARLALTPPEKGGG